MRTTTRVLRRLAVTAFVTGAPLVASASPARADDPDPQAQGTAFTGRLALEGAASSGVAALCSAFISDAKAQAAAHAAEEEAPHRPPRCVPDAAVVQLTTSGPLRAARVLWLDDGAATRRQLALVTPSGIYLTWFAWDVDDPRDPGCPSIIRDVAIEQLRIEHGALVVVAQGERTAYVEQASDDDPGYRAELVRTAHWFVPQRGPTVASQSGAPQPWFWSEVLGTKVQPRADARVPWATLPWSGKRELHLDAAGRPRIDG
jgi:hypothetical protein